MIISQYDASTLHVSIGLTVEHAATRRDIVLVKLLHRCTLLLSHFHDDSPTCTLNTVYITQTPGAQYLSQYEAMPNSRVSPADRGDVCRRVESRGSALSR